MSGAGQTPLRRWLAASLLLHGALAAVPLLAGRWPAPPATPEPLLMELAGLVSHVQVQQQAMRRDAAQPAAPQRQVVRGAAADSPVQVRKEAPRATNAVARDAPARAADDAPAPGAEYERVQQAVAAPAPETDAGAVRRYVQALGKAIQENLVYPAQARESGQAGAPVVRFTLLEGGELLPGSLAIHRSSGYLVLDDYALRAVLAGTPFRKPPRRMDVVLALSFTQDS